MLLMVDIDYLIYFMIDVWFESKTLRIFKNKTPNSVETKKKFHL